ncbi:hypothetical protein AAG906_016147 [Vitis piasezkii]
MKNQALSSIGLCQSRSKYARREARRRGKQSEENRDSSCSLLCTFGALPDVHFLHSIYHFKSQEVKNPMLQTVHDLELKRRSYSHFKKITPKFNQTRGFFLEDERLSFLSLGVKKAGYLLRAFDGNPRLKITLNVTGTPFLYEEPEPSDLNSKKQLFFISKISYYFWLVINFVDYSLNQGAPAGHESAETPIGHESNGTTRGFVIELGRIKWRPEEAMNFMSYMAEVSRGCDEPNARDMGE